MLLVLGVVSSVVFAAAGRATRSDSPTPVLLSEVESTRALAHTAAPIESVTFQGLPPGFERARRSCCMSQSRAHAGRGRKCDPNIRTGSRGAGSIAFR